MSTITLPNIRVGSDLQVRVRLKDGGVAIDWSTLQNIKACIYSDAQRALAGRCAFSIDEEDNTLLVCTYAANKPQYLGVNRIVISAKYMGETKTYDKPAFSFVRWTADQEGEEITIDDPDVDVEIDVEDVSSSILQEAVDAAFTAADRANEAAAAAEHMVDIHTGPEGKSAYEVAVEEGYTGTEEEWLASLKGDTGETPDISIGTVTTVEPGTPAAASMTGTPEEPVLNLSIPQGVVGATPNFTVGTVTTGEPGSSVIVTITGTPEAPVLNVTIPQGMQGNTGSSVDYPYELVNNLTTNDATKGLSAAQGVVLDGKVSQLEAKVTDLQDGETVLQQQIDAIQPVVIEGNVTNAPDNEDITATPDNRLKFADRPATLTNKGYKILRVDKTFASQVTDINTIYEIRYAFDLDGDEFTMPAGCTLSFHGGNIGNGVLICNGTTIAIDYAGFKNIEIKGTITNISIKTGWFDVGSYANDWDFLTKYFAVGQSDEMNGLVYEMSGDYKLDIEDYDKEYSPSDPLGRFFIISHSFVLRGNNVAFHIVKNGVPLTLAEADSGECRGMFGIFPVISGVVFDIFGATFDAGVGEEIGTITTSTSLHLNRNIFRLWRSSSIVIDGRTATGNIAKGVVDNCIFEHCYCETLICMDGVFAIKDHFICRNTTFRNSGGAAYNVSGASIVENCVFEHLTSGGAMETTLRNFASTIVSGCKFVNVQTVCSILDGYNENLYTDALARSFVFENCICKNTEEFNSLVTGGGASIYGVMMTNVAVCRISGCYFENILENTIRTHAEVNGVFNRAGFYPDVIVEGCTFRNSRIHAGESFRRISIVKCISYGQSLCRMPGTGNSTISFKDCVYKYEISGPAANLACDFPLGAYIDFIAKAKNANGLGAYQIQVQDASRGQYMFIDTPSSSSDTEMTVQRERYLYQVPTSRTSIGQLCNVRMTVVAPVANTTTEVTIRVGSFQNVGLISGTTANRPNGVPVGFNYFDKDINRLLVWNGTDWDIVGDKLLVETVQPAGGMLSGVVYQLGELSGTFTVVLAPFSDTTSIAHYYLTFETGNTVPSITWPNNLVWVGSLAPQLSANKHYEVSILNGVASYIEA